MSEKKYIDAEKFKNTLKESLILSPDTAEEFSNLGIVFAISRINSMPAANVEEVVRCKDCKYARKEKEVYGIADFKCLKTLVTCLDADDFCSYGERQEAQE